MKRILFCVCFLSLNISVVLGAKFLLLSFSVISHANEIFQIGTALLEKGHEVHFVVHEDFSPSTVSLYEKYGVKMKYFKVPKDGQTFLSPNMVTLVENVAQTGVFNPFLVQTTAMNECEYLLEDKVLRSELIAERYDMSILDGFPLCRCLTILPESLGIPFVMGGIILEPFMLGIPLFPSFVPCPLGPLSDQMTFMERLTNVFLTLGITFMKYHGNSNTTLLEKYVNDPNIQSFNDLTDKALLNIVPRDHLLEWPVYIPPNVLVTGGLSPTPAAPLPPEFLHFVKDAKEGVIVLSFGSIMKTLPLEMTVKFINVFKTLKQRVVWSFRGDHTAFKADIPDNVLISKWIPQNDLLGHPNVKLFITHCGNNGQYEALYHGVPMIGFPIAGDQAHNAYRIVTKGLGISLTLRTFTEQMLQDAIHEILKNPKYSKSIKKLSNIWKDRPMTERQRVAWYIEHVLKFGNSHVKPYGLQMPWYQFYMIDVLVLLIACCIGICYITTKGIKCLCRKCCTRKEKVN